MKPLVFLLGYVRAGRGQVDRTWFCHAPSAADLSMRRASTQTRTWRGARNKDACPVRAFNLSPQIFDRANTQVSGGSPKIRGYPADADFGKARGSIGFDHEDHLTGSQIVRTASDFRLGLTRRYTFFRILLRNIGVRPADSGPAVALCYPVGVIGGPARRRKCYHRQYR